MFRYDALVFGAPACAALNYSVLRTSPLRGRRVRGVQFGRAASLVGQTAELVGFLPS
jgi:hypothetical protein